MKLTLTQLKNFIKWAKDQNIREIKIGDIQIIFDNATVGNTTDTFTGTPEPTNEDILFYSS